MNDEERQILNEVIAALQSKEYDPYGQIYAYVKTGNDLYITSKDDARNKIKQVSDTALEQYLKENI
ncbi:MAG: IreB family regulatory phosphoprotein [Clostridia bacterium]|nr:IreB family regulatory phosphoprotein [Clostridia bacterium]